MARLSGVDGEAHVVDNEVSIVSGVRGGQAHADEDGHDVTHQSDVDAVSDDETRRRR